MGIVLVAFFAANGVGPPEVTIRSTFRRTNSAASSRCRSGPLFSANRYSMVIVFSSIQPSLLSSCRNASKKTAIPEAVLGSRKPMRKIFPGCCASASETFAKKRVASSQRVILLFTFFSRLVPHAFCLFSFDQPIRSGEHLRRNRQADLIRRLEINHQLELRGLFHRQIGRLGSLQNPVHVICDAPVAVREVRPVGHQPAGICKFSVVVHGRQSAL